MKSTKLLNDIANIHAGYSFRSAILDAGFGVAVIQAKDVSGLYLQSSVLPKVDQVFPNTRLLGSGDVVLTTRGSFRASVVDLKIKAIASSSLHVIRLKTDEYLPEFVALFLNSPQTQNYIKQSAKGATIQSVSAADLGMARIPLVALEDQKLLVKLQQNVERQSKLLESKASIINRVYNNTISKSLQGVTS